MGPGWLNIRKVRRLEWIVTRCTCCVSRESMELRRSCEGRSYRSWLNIMCNELWQNLCVILLLAYMQLCVTAW
jgi:hypothetical protein